jgi:hypothetical protein
MATQRQIDANRRNAGLSTGPRTPQGKAVSSMNALQSGLDADSQFVIGEERSDFYALQNEYFQMIRPRNPCERFQMDRMLRSEWLLRRMFRAESHVWEYHGVPSGSRADRSEGVPLGEAWATASPIFMRIHRRNAALERAYQQAWDELRRVRGGSAPLMLTGDLDSSGPPLPGDTPVLEDPPVPEQFAGEPSPEPPTTAPEASPQPLETKDETAQLGSFLQAVPNPPSPPVPEPPIGPFQQRLTPLRRKPHDTRVDRPKSRGAAEIPPPPTPPPKGSGVLLPETVPHRPAANDEG